MSIDFAKLVGLQIPVDSVMKGVTQIEDSAGRILWAMLTATDEPAAIFEVAKQTNDSYDGETVYTDNNFILLDIYPKKYGTVTVTYGGVTRTITDESGVAAPNAQQVCFGRFSGQTYDDVTPASGRVTIEGAYRGYGAGSYNFKNSTTGKSNSTYAHCLTGIVDFGNPVYIGAETLAYCDFLTSITLPGNLENIAYHLFSYSKNLAEVIVPKSVKSIGSQPFYYGNDTMTVILRGIPTDTSNLDLEYNGSDFTYNIDVRYEVDNFNWDDWAMHTPATPYREVEDSVNPYKYYNRYVYINGVDVKTITNVNLTNCAFIANGAFKLFSALTSINIPNSVKRIGNYAFDDCDALTNVTIPHGVTSIGQGAFRYCDDLRDIIIPDSVTEISFNAFYGCSKLQSIVLPKGLTSIEHNTFYDCESLTSITIPVSVTSIDHSAFYDCSGLTSITIPDGVTSIGRMAFRGCSALTSVTFENTSGWYVTETEGGDASTGIPIDVTNTATNATMLTDTYAYGYYWYRA